MTNVPTGFGTPRPPQLGLRRRFERPGARVLMWQ